MIIPNTKGHPNNTKTDQLPISEVITGLPRPYHHNCLYFQVFRRSILQILPVLEVLWGRRLQILPVYILAVYRAFVLRVLLRSYCEYCSVRTASTAKYSQYKKCHIEELSIPYDLALPREDAFPGRIDYYIG